MFAKNDQLPLLRAYSPDIPNGLSLTEREFAVPDPHGPVVAGRDLFRQVTERALAAHQVRVRWVEDYSWAHAGGGEVHCTTNAWRATEPVQANRQRVAPYGSAVAMPNATRIEKR
ncbi:protein-arginine deiminase family protein [Nonomuraea sp. NPDC050536]|uniref:protein-arginine deiminase family protein n=1 Tax=Nonomuraea sp. NPDC050536 TaxID=3364366 RepID=UPI0037C757FD